MAAKGGRIDFMFLGPLLTRLLDPLLITNDNKCSSRNGIFLKYYYVADGFAIKKTKSFNHLKK